jgi:hypothetical protein
MDNPSPESINNSPPESIDNPPPDIINNPPPESINNSPPQIIDNPPPNIINNPPPASYPAPTYQQKPGMVQAIAIMTLINGILNILAAFAITASIVLGTIGFGICCSPLTILPGVLGIFEIIYATKLLANPPRPVQPSQTIAILEICCILSGNVISLVVGILALVFYGDPAVKEYFARINSPQA